MKPRGKKVLALVLGEKSILIAETAVAAGATRITRSGEFVFEAPLSLTNPAALGAALAQYLSREGFTARSAVFGLPAKWVLSKNRELPPVDPVLAADMMRLSIESEFSSELKDLVYDYAGESDAAGPTQVLLLATPRKHIEQIEAIAEAARLEVQAVTPTAVVLAATRPDATILSVTASGVELAACRSKTVSLIRHIANGGPITPAIAGEVRRATMMLPRPPGATSTGAVLVFDDANSEAATLAALGLGASAARASSLGDIEPEAKGVSAAAAALAVAGSKASRLPIDFSHSRLAAPKKSAIPRQMVLAIVAGAAVVLLAVLAFTDLQRQEHELADLKARLAETAPTQKSAQAEVDMIKYAQGWHAGQPRYLDCIKDLTLAIPEDANMYVTNLELHESMKGAVSGKAPTDKSVLSLVERLKNSKRFLEVKLAMDTKDARTGREVSFSINFRYVPHTP